MPNHPNRNKAYQVTPAQIIALRGDLTQDAASKLWRTNIRTVQRWEAGDIRPSYCTWVGMQTIIARLRD
jgi:DNA-binding transcriptional regulator YiaG